jgi:hypothetical protein
MSSIPHDFTCFSWNVRQHATADTQCTHAGVDYKVYVLNTVIGFVQQADNNAVLIGLQGLCTTTFQLLKTKLTARYEERIVFHFSPHTCVQHDWQAHYEMDSVPFSSTAINMMYGSMIVYLAPRGDRQLLQKSKEIICDSHELDRGSSSMPCVYIKHMDNTTLQLVCVHLADTETMRAEQQAQLSRVLSSAVADLTIVTGVLGDGRCMLPGYTDSVAQTVAETYPSVEPTCALSDSWAVNSMCKGLAVEHASAEAIRLLHMEHVSVHLPTCRVISLHSDAKGIRKMCSVC